MDKILVLFLLKVKNLKNIKETKDKPLKKCTTKALEDMYINLKSKKMTKQKVLFLKVVEPVTKSVSLLRKKVDVLSKVQVQF